jgi:hypothetical protein
VEWRRSHPVEAEPAAEADRAADPLADHRVARGAEPLGVALVGGLRVEGVAEMQAEQRVGRRAGLQQED